VSSYRATGAAEFVTRLVAEVNMQPARRLALTQEDE
jgi:hypothetical protein